MSKIKQIHLRTSGGMGIPIEGSIDVDALPPELARHVQKTLAPRKLARMSRRPRAAHMTDQIAYEITLPDDRREFISYTILESQADDDLLEVLDELTARIIEEKMRERKAARKQAEPEEEDDPASSSDPPLVQGELFPISTPAPNGRTGPQDENLGP